MPTSDEATNWLVFGGKSPLEFWPDIEEEPQTHLLRDSETGEPYYRNLNGEKVWVES